MKSWRFHEFGEIENLRLEEIDIPEPADGEALVKLEFAALNPADRFMVMGKYPRPAPRPFSVGRDGCGTIEKAASGGRFKAGDRVVILRSDIGVSRDGTLAEYVTVPEDALAPLPSGWSSAEGAAGPLVLLTAWQALVIEGGCDETKTVFVTGGSGGVGSASILLAKALGARVVATSRSESKRKWLTDELGADFVFDSENPDLEKTVIDALDGGRCDIVVENLAGPYLQKSIDVTGHQGRVCVPGLLAGLKSEIVIGSILFKRIRIIGINVGDYAADEAQEAWKQIVATLAQSGKRPPVDKQFEMKEVIEAFDHLAKGPRGKVVIKVSAG